MPKIVSLAVHCRQIHREDLLAEYAADNPLSAEEIGYTSRKNVTWSCAYGHTETESPYNRLRRGYCKTCGKDKKVLLPKTTRRRPDSGQRKIRFYPLRSAPLIQSRFCGSAIRDIYGNAALRRRFMRRLPAPSAKRKQMRCSHSIRNCWQNGIQNGMETSPPLPSAL